MSSGLVVGRLTGPLISFNSTYGHCLRLWTMDPFFSFGVSFFRLCKSSFFRGRRIGGRSGEILILSSSDFRSFAFCYHVLRCCKFLNRTITPASSLGASLWQAKKNHIPRHQQCWGGPLLAWHRTPSPSPSPPPLPSPSPLPLPLNMGN